MPSNSACTSTLRPIHAARLWAQALLLTSVAVLSACSERSPPAPATPPAPTGAAPVTSAPAAPVAVMPAPPAPATASSSMTPMPAVASAAREVPLSVQGVASAGLTVRVKGIELGEDATILTISASFGGQAATYTKLAAVETYLEDPDGHRLMLKRPDDNKDLKIMNGDTMEGKLVFLGRVAPTATQVRLVINDGSESDNTIGPGLAIVLPLKG